jgi:NTP pyrophosphatase (non-canonical NTP hydrolase)
MSYLTDVAMTGATFADSVAAELDKARSAFPREQSSAHEGFAILKEEVDELWDMVRLKQSKRDAEAMFKELVQIAAMAQRMAEEVVMRGRLHV